jgi:hypothetical protein
MLEDTTEMLQIQFGTFLFSVWRVDSFQVLASGKALEVPNNLR